MSVSEKMFVLVFSISMLVVVLPTVVTQQPPSIAPSSAPNCMNIIASNMGDCFDYVSRNSSFESPSESCCSGLATVVKNEFQCLCQFLQDSDYRLSINTSRVLHLPSICDVNATLSQCQNAPDGPVNSSTPSKSTTIGIRLLLVVFTVLFLLCFCF